MSEVSTVPAGIKTGGQISLEVAQIKFGLHGLAVRRQDFDVRDIRLKFAGIEIQDNFLPSAIATLRAAKVEGLAANLRRPHRVSLRNADAVSVERITCVVFDRFGSSGVI